MKKNSKGVYAVDLTFSAAIRSADETYKQAIQETSALIAGAFGLLAGGMTLVAVFSDYARATLMGIADLWAADPAFTVARARLEVFIEVFKSLVDPMADITSALPSGLNTIIADAMTNVGVKSANGFTDWPHSSKMLAVAGTQALRNNLQFVLEGMPPPLATTAATPKADTMAQTAWLVAPGPDIGTGGTNGKPS